MIHRIAIIRAGALGDTVLAVPALAMLRERHPAASLTAVGYSETWAIAGSLVDEIRSIDDARLRGFLPARLMQLGFDRVIAWTADEPGPAIRRAISELTHASPFPPPGVHASVWLLRTLDLPDDAASIERALAVWRASLLAGKPEDEGASARSSQDLKEAGSRPGNVIIHPGAGAAWKCWPPERFAALADSLAARGRPVEVIEGPADRRAVDAMRTHTRLPFAVLSEPSLTVLARRLSRAGLYIGNDSGVTHLAAAVGAPVIALFGPTDPVCWAPLGNSRVLRACIARAEHQGQVKVCNDPICMQRLSTDAVLAAVTEYLDTPKPRVETLVQNPQV